MFILCRQTVSVMSCHVCAMSTYYIAQYVISCKLVAYLTKSDM